MLNLIDKFLNSFTTVTVRFYMKSGNVVVVRNVHRSMKVKCNGNEVVSISGFKQSWYTRRKMLMQGLALDQIEAITY